MGIPNHKKTHPCGGTLCTFKNGGLSLGKKLGHIAFDTFFDVRNVGSHEIFPQDILIKFDVTIGYAFDIGIVHVRYRLPFFALEPVLDQPAPYKFFRQLPLFFIIVLALLVTIGVEIA